MCNEITIFISSVMNEEFNNDRDAVERAINSLGAKAWRFEGCPASTQPPATEYLSKIDDCTLFIVLLSDDITTPVKFEFVHADVLNKPILVFLKANVSRSNNLTEFMNDHVNRKYTYRPYTTENLEEHVKNALLHLIEQNFQFRNHIGFSERAIKKYADDQENVRALRISDHLRRSNLLPLKRGSARSPREMIKEVPRDETLLPIIAELPKIDSLKQQVDYLITNQFARLYPESWIEQEMQLIGLYVLEFIVKQRYIDLTQVQNVRVYDAGCGSRAQYIALQASLLRREGIPITYQGQDYDPDWKRDDVDIKELPMVKENGPYDLVACAHVLQDHLANPLSLYACLLSFNGLLRRNGVCYVTVPVKDSYPGLLDVLERCAMEAYFDVKKAGRNGLQHQLLSNPDDPRNFTSFDYMIIQKVSEANPELRRQVLGLSFLRWHDPDTANKYDSSQEHPNLAELLLLERELEEVLKERNQDVRTFRVLAEWVFKVWKEMKMAKEAPNASELTTLIRESIDDVHKKIEGNTEDLARACIRYLARIIASYLCRSPQIARQNIVLQIYPMVEDNLRNPRDVRVKLERLAQEDLGRLIRHLFDLCRSERVFIRDEMKAPFVQTNSIRKWLLPI